MAVIVLIVILVAGAAYWFFNRPEENPAREILLQVEYIMHEGESADIAYERGCRQARQKSNDLLASLISRQLTEPRRLSLGERIAFVAAGCGEFLVMENRKEPIASGVRMSLKVRVIPAMQRVQKLIRLAEDLLIVQEFDTLQSQFEQNRQELAKWKEKTPVNGSEQQAAEFRSNEVSFQKLLFEERIFWLRHLQQPETVINACSRMLELDGENRTAYIERGRAYIRLKLFDEAQSDLDKAAALTEDQTAVGMARAELLDEKGQLTEAIAELTGMLEQNPTPAVFLRRGEIYEKMNQYSQAMEDYTETLKLEPDYITAYIKRAFMREIKGQTQEALEDLTSVLARDPYHLDALNLRARLLDNQGQPESALLDLNQAILIEPDDVTSHNNRGNLHYQAGRLELAINDYNKAISLAPADADSYFNKARALEKQGHMIEAVEAYKLFLRFAPANDLAAERVHAKLKMLLRDQ
ncbi:tetratricopeptide repeat protein [Acetonema longum]|uniref:Peptidase C14 caspase catalytic subunit p20 n=1 Tax=Acetonema longum DSM 6540 TaxID=1009370 RepID=F7NGI2_9FIRM|nr:tetratricopeptide repeat protein [Acetonema longum]EGO64786.1 peptidase C14 caspase catalytic subunit p20 [Acetonema longum DSM 6540]